MTKLEKKHGIKERKKWTVKKFVLATLSSNPQKEGMEADVQSYNKEAAVWILPRPVVFLL